ncbi:MAG: carbohydrate ABC transporter permease [Methanobacteriota archaeon]|nr:MAG: carbohydrate ABC transporter permease [Euryarchaeota archaeon]
MPFRLRLPRRARTVLVHVVAWSIGLLWLVPFLGVLMASIRPFSEIVYGWWQPSPFTASADHFEQVWNHPTYPLSSGFRNSFIVAIPSTLIPMFVASVAAYGFARFRFPMRDYLFLSIVVLMAVPQQMVAVPIFLQMNSLGLLDNHLSLILVHSAWGLPWILLFMRNFFLTLPVEVEEAARVDGASDFKIFYRIVLPMALPALAAVTVLQFMWVWNDYFFALILISPFSDQQLATQLVPKLGIGQYNVDWGLLSAASLLVLLVPVLVYSLLQRFYIRGMVGWTIKG